MSLFEVLPAELISQVLFELDPASFYICLQTSRLFRAHALASTKLIHDQLYRIPGERVFYDNVIGDANYLLRLFSKRATQHLFNGAEQMADIHVWQASPSMDRKTSCLTTSRESEHAQAVMGKSLPPADPINHTLLFLETKSAQGVVNIYSINDSGLTLKHVISSHMVSQHLPGDQESGTSYTVVKVAAENVSLDRGVGPKLAILYAPLYAPTQPPLDPVKGCMTIICFRLEPAHDPVITDIYRAAVDSCPNSKAIVAMALNADGDPVIAYKTASCHTIYKIVTFKNVFDNLALKRYTELEYETLIQPFDAEEPVGALAVRGKNIHLCPAAIPMPYWTVLQISSSRDGRRHGIQRRDTSLPDIVDAFLKQSLGRVLASHHHHRIEDKDLNDGAPTCVNTALELMIARDDALAPYGGLTRQGIFLLKALHYPPGLVCEQFYMDRDYPSLQHVFVAKLDGLPLDNLSSIGLKLAVSPRAHRIAIAHWRTLLVYALDTKAFLDPAYVESNGDAVPGDYAYIDGCGWQYYESNDFERECVILKPVKLECKGVVFGLEWRNESELWGWTDEGVVRWRVGANAKGRRGTAALDDSLLECPTTRGVDRSGGRADKAGTVRSASQM